MLLRRHYKNKATQEPTEAVEQVINTIVFEDVTKAQISLILSEKGIEHNPRDKKEDLYNLLLGSE